jgi:hypothetical protein
MRINVRKHGEGDFAAVSIDAPADDAAWTTQDLGAAIERTCALISLAPKDTRIEFQILHSAVAYAVSVKIKPAKESDQTEANFTVQRLAPEVTREAISALVRTMGASGLSH